MGTTTPTPPEEEFYIPAIVIGGNIGEESEIHVDGDIEIQGDIGEGTKIYAPRGKVTISGNIAADVEIEASDGISANAAHHTARLEPGNGSLDLAISRSDRRIGGR